MSDNGHISDILSSSAEVQKYYEQNKKRLLAKVEEVRGLRRAIKQRAIAHGLHIRDSIFPQALDDIFETDDTGKLIDTFFKIKVETPEDVSKALLFCKAERLLALPIGAKTSALGVFEARNLGERFGLKGVVGISFDDLVCSEAVNQCDSIFLCTM